MRFMALHSNSTGRQIDRKSRRVTPKVRQALVDPVKVTAVFAALMMNAKELESDPH
jgi:hypothetical protein